MGKLSQGTLVIAPTPFFSNRGCHIRIFNYLQSYLKEGRKLLIVTYPIGSNLPPELKKFEIKRIPNLFPFYKKTTPGPDLFRVFYDSLIAFYGTWYFLKVKPKTVVAFLHESFFSILLIKVFRKIFRIKTIIILDLQDDLGEQLLKFKFIPKPLLFLVGFFEKILFSLPDLISMNKKELICLNENLLSKHRRNPRLFKIVEDFPYPGINFERRVISEDKGIAFIYTGGFTKEKGIENMLAFFKKNRDRFDYNLNLVVAGGGDAAFIRALGRKYGMGFKIIDNLKYFELPEILEQAEIGVEPKTDSTEGSGKIVNYVKSGMLVLIHKDFYKNNKSWLERFAKNLVFFEDPNLFSFGYLKKRLEELG